MLAAGPALARGKPIGKCTTINKPGSYVVTRNLAAVGDCLVVAADFVTLDLGGWVIKGDGRTGSGVTDQRGPRRGIVVRNGTVTGFSDGVVLSRTSRAVVEKVWAIDNDSSGIGVGDGSIVRGNTASGLIRVIAAGKFSIVSGNTVDAKTEVGISTGPGSTVSGNTLINGDLVMVILPGSTFTGNTLLCEHSCTGMRVECPSNVIGNTATGYGPNLGLIGEGCTNIDNLVR